MIGPALRLVGLALLVAALGCSKKESPVRERTAARVVSLTPSTTEAVFAVGAGAELVGRSRYCDFPPEVKTVPQVGGYVDPSLEAILALSPDLVVGARGPSGTAITDKLAARGIATYFPKTESFAEIDAMILGVGERTGHASEARAKVDALHASLSAIDAAVAKLPKRRVLVVFGAAPLSVAGPGGFPDEMIRRAGGENVVTEGGAYPTLGVERVLVLDPDVVVDAAMAEEHARIGPTTPGWEKVRAVTEGHVVRLSNESVIRPGPRIADGVRELARAIHPDVRIVGPEEPK